MTDTATKKPRTRTKRSLGEWATIVKELRAAYTTFELSAGERWEAHVTLATDALTILHAHGVTVQELLDSAEDISALIALFKR